MRRCGFARPHARRIRNGRTIAFLEHAKNEQTRAKPDGPGLDWESASGSCARRAECCRGTCSGYVRLLYSYPLSWPLRSGVVLGEARYRPGWDTRRSGCSALARDGARVVQETCRALSCVRLCGTLVLETSSCWDTHRRMRVVSSVMIEIHLGGAAGRMTKYI